MELFLLGIILHIIYSTYFIFLLSKVKALSAVSKCMLIPSAASEHSYTNWSCPYLYVCVCDCVMRECVHACVCVPKQL